MYRYTIVAEQDQKTKTFEYDWLPEKIRTLNSSWAQSYIDLKFTNISSFLNVMFDFSLFSPYNILKVFPY